MPLAGLPTPGSLPLSRTGRAWRGVLTALGHADVPVGVEEDVAVGTEAALCQPHAQRALAPARQQRQIEGEGKGHGADLGSTSGPGWEVGWGKGTPEVWSWGPGASWVSSWLPTRSSGPAREARCPRCSLPVSWAHLESQDSGCTGPHDLYTLVGGQARSGGTQTGVKRAEEARAPGGHAQLTAQPVGGVAPVGADAPGAAELCVGLQALAEHRAPTAGPAAVTDTGVEVWARWDEAVAPGEDPAGRAHQRLEQRPLRVMAPPTTTQPSWRTHGLSIRSHRGSGGHDGWMAGVLLPGRRGLVVAGRPVGSPQPSPLLSETSQDRAMSWQVRAMVPSGRRHSSLRLLVQVPGEGGV